MDPRTGFCLRSRAWVLCLCGLGLIVLRVLDVAGEATKAQADGVEAQELPVLVRGWQAWSDPLLTPTGPYAPGGMQIAAHGGGSWVAALVPGGHVRIWELDEGAQLQRCVWRTPDAGNAAYSLAWVGDRIVLSELRATRDLSDLYNTDPLEPSPYGDLDAYITERSRTTAVDPATGTCEVLIARRAGQLVCDPEGGHLVLCNATHSGHVAEAAHVQADVQVHSARDGALLGDFKPEIGAPLDGSLVGAAREPRVLFTDGDARVFWAIGLVDGVRLAHEDKARPQRAVAVIDIEGGVHFLTDGRDCRLRPYLPGFPAVVTASDGTSTLACMLERLPGMSHRLSFYRPSGELVREYDLGLRWGCLREATGRQGQWIPLTVTPDGHWLLVHAVGDWGCPPARGDPCCIWMWHLDRHVALPVARLHNITGSFGWVHDEYLILEVQAQNETGREYGVLHVPWKTLGRDHDAEG